MRIVVQMAMREEARHVIGRLGLGEAAGFGQRLPFLAYEGEVGSARVGLALAGVDERHGVDQIGTQPAALLAHLAIERWGPDLLLNAGTAGAFGAHGAGIGDVYLAQPPVVFHDRRIPIPGFDRYGEGGYPCMEAAGLARELGLRTGIVSTGDALGMTEADLEAMRASGATLKEMEAAAIAWVCWMHGVEFLAVKAVTDLLDDPAPTEEAFLANLRVASERLGAAVEAVVGRLAGAGTG